MRKTLFFLAFLCAARAHAAPAKVAAIPETLSVRAAAWDLSWKPATDEAWRDRVVAAVAAAAKDGIDVVVFPENVSNGRGVEPALSAIRDAAGADRLVVLGGSPLREPGRDYAVSRAYILANGAWQTMDKLDPTPAERASVPPVKAGMRLPLIRFRGGVVAALAGCSIEKTEIAASLKKRAVQLVLVFASAEDEAGAARVARTASSRAVELGAAVVTAPPSPAAPALYLPAQKGLDLKPQAPAGGDFRVPWKKLLELRAPGSDEPRPFLDPAPGYQVEI